METQAGGVDETHGTERTGYVLVVGSDGADRDYVVSALRWGTLECHAWSEDALLEADDVQPPALVVLDHGGPAPEVRASIDAMLGHAGLIGVPLLVLSYVADIDSFSGAIAAGAAAYLVKPVGAEELVAVVRKLTGWTGVTDRTEKRRRLRRPLILKIDVHVRGRRLQVPGQIVDASGGGCRIEVSQALQPGELLRLVLHSHAGSTHLALGAEVRWARQAPDGTHVAGVRFTGTTAVHAGHLLGFASRAMD